MGPVPVNRTSNWHWLLHMWTGPKPKAMNSHKHLHIPCHTSPDLSYTMPCLSGHTIYHAITRQAISYTMQYLARPYHMPCQARQAISYTMQNIARPYHAMPTRPYHISSPYLARPLRYTMSCPTDHASYHAMPARPHHMSWHNRQTIRFTMPCLPGHTI